MKTGIGNFGGYNMETFLFDVLFSCFEIIKAILCIYLGMYLFAIVIVLGLIVFVVMALILRLRKKRNITYKDFF